MAKKTVLRENLEKEERNPEPAHIDKWCKCIGCGFTRQATKDENCNEIICPKCSASMRQKIVR